MPAPVRSRPRTRALDPPRPWDAESRWSLGLLSLATLLSLRWWVVDAFDPEPDACLYIQVARNLLAGEGYSLLHEPFGVRPPGFSALLAPALATWDTDFRVLNTLVSLFGIAGVTLLFLHARPRLGSRIALALSLLLWLNPGYRTLCNQVMSDVPGVALTLGCLVLEKRWREKGAAHGFLLGLCVGLAGLVRTMSLLLLPAILAASYLRERRAPGPSAPWFDRRARALSLGVLLAAGPWFLRNALTDFPVPARQTTLYSYATGLLRRDLSDPTSELVSLGDLLARPGPQLEQTLRSLGSRLGAAESTGVLPFALGAIVLACLVRVAWRRREPAELWCLGMLAVVASYFTYDDRLVVLIFALALPATLEVLVEFLVRRGGRPSSGVRTGLAAALVVLALVDVRWKPDVAHLEARSREMGELAARIEASVPAGVAIASRQAPELAVYLEGRDVYSIRFCTRSGYWSELRPFLEGLELRYCLLARTAKPDGVDPVALRRWRRRQKVRQIVENDYLLRGQFGEWCLYERKPVRS